MDVVGAGDTLVLTGSIQARFEDIYTRLMAQLLVAVFSLLLTLLVFAYGGY